MNFSFSSVTREYGNVLYYPPIKMKKNKSHTQLKFCYHSTRWIIESDDKFIIWLYNDDHLKAGMNQWEYEYFVHAWPIRYWHIKCKIEMQNYRKRMSSESQPNLCNNKTKTNNLSRLYFFFARVFSSLICNHIEHQMNVQSTHGRSMAKKASESASHRHLNFRLYDKIWKISDFPCKLFFSTSQTHTEPYQIVWNFHFSTDLFSFNRESKNKSELLFTKTFRSFILQKF